jgi:colanic acid/amylovoran biosynthesis glycosyltransferase
MTPKICYLVATHPAVSQTFIEREISALRRRGVELATFSIRHTPADELLSEVDRLAAAETFYIRPVRWQRLVDAHVVALRTRPARYAVTLIRALRLSAGGVRSNVWQLFYFAQAIILWQECRRRGINHVHVHFANVASAVALLSAHFGEADGMSWSFTMHGPTEFDDVTRFALRDKVEAAKFVACISDYCRSQLMKLVAPEYWEKLSVVHCGLKFEGGDPEVAARPLVRDEVPGLAVLSVGRLVPDKGQRLLLEAVAELGVRGVPVSLTIVGDGPEREGLHRQAQQLGISDRVSFAGALGQPQVSDLFSNADVFCLASFAEGVPVVLMEAMSHGLPVVATRLAGIAELVEDDVSGALVSPGRADLLADALARLAGDPALRAAWGAAGRRRVRLDYDVDDSARRLAALFGAAPAMTRVDSGPVEPMQTVAR